jgi:hypothetical protein
MERVREWIRLFIPGLIGGKWPGRKRKFPEDVLDEVRAIIGDAPSGYRNSRSCWTLIDIYMQNRS